MKRVFALLCSLCILSLILPQGIDRSSIMPVASAATDSFNTTPAIEALKRLIPNHYQQVRLVAVTPNTEGEYFRISSREGQVEITGTSPAVMLTGFNWYLKYVANANISWNGEQLNLPQQLPLPIQEIVQQANVPHRFAFNDTDDGYTGAYRSWKDWERMIDVLALNGINEVLVTVGQEAVYYDTFQEFGYSAQEMRNWITLPAHQPWWLLQNMCCYGSPVSENLIEQRTELGKKIADHLREMGMTPVFPGYFGTVPENFVSKNPGARVVPQGNWVGSKRPDWLDPRNTLFPRVAEAFYRNQKELFGETNIFKMDLLHEGGTPGDVPVATAAKAVETALQTAHPGAIWAILGWQSNPSPTLLSSLDKTKVLILDGISDRYSNLNREQDWPGTPYAFGSIWNFGGHTTMGANLSVWNTKYWQWKAKSGSNLTGIALMPEGGENNPVAFDFFTELAWQKGPVDLDDWFETWTLRRYGEEDVNAQAAWKTLQRTAYNMPADGWSEAQDGLFGAQPSLTVSTAANWSPKSIRYDSAAFDLALPTMLQVKPELRSSSAYQYDLMDITRQVLSNRSRILLPQIKTAYDAKDKESFTALTTKWLSWMKLLDEVAATNKQMMLGPWLENAKKAASDDAERAKLEFDARSIITVWGDRSASQNGGLNDYANREWAGLVGDYYYYRWKTYFDELNAAMTEGRQPKQIDWFAVGDTWTKQQNVYPTEPQGDVYLVASKVLNEIGNSSSIGITVTADNSVISPSVPVTITATIKNDNSFMSAQGINVSIVANPSFNVKALTATTADQVAPGKSVTVKYEVTLKDGYAGSMINTLAIESAYRYGDVAKTSKGSIKLLASNDIKAPYKTVSFNNAQFGHAGNSFGIYGGGSDLWQGTQGFGTIYQDNALSSDTTVITRVVHQDNTWGWARAGIIARNDLTVNGSGGYVNIALTPSNGCSFTWDQNGDGQFDTVSSKSEFSTQAYIKLTRSGSTFTGSCSTDGTTWTTVGTATLTSAATIQDVGLFMSAVNVNSQLNGLVEFEGFSVTSKGVPVTGIQVDKASVILTEGQTSDLIVTVMPSNALNKNVKVSISDATVAHTQTENDGKVVITGVKAGTATITITTVDGDYKAISQVKVLPQTANLALNKPTTAKSSSSPSLKGNDGDLTSMWIANSGSADNWWSVDLGDNYDLTGSKIHFEKQVLWKYKIEISKDNTNWVTIVDKMNNTDTSQVQTHSLNNAQGRYVRITFDQAPGQNWTSFQELLVFGYPVQLPVTSVQVDKGAVTLNPGDTAELVATIQPINATNKNVTWSSSDETVASVVLKDGKAIVTGGKAGISTITVSTVDGKYTATTQVTVTKIITGPITTLVAPTSVFTGQSFTVRLGLSDVTQGVYGQDLKVAYDPTVMEFVSSHPVQEGISIVSKTEGTAGSVRFIIASQGSDHAISGSADVLVLTFKAKDVTQPVLGRISVEQAVLGDALGDEMNATLTSTNVTITTMSPGTTGDVNGDNKVSLGDLAVIAVNYGKDSTSADWELVKKADINSDNKIDIDDLVRVAKLIIK